MMVSEGNEGHREAGGCECTPRFVQTMLANPESGLVLLDCRTEEEWERARIEGAILIPLHELPERAHELDGYNGRPIVVYCHHGRRSLRAAAILRAAGHGGALSMTGGIERWSDEIDPRVPRYTR